MVCSWWWKGIPEKKGNPIIIGEPYIGFCGKKPSENKIETGIYYFENDVHKMKIPRKLISKKKLFAANKRGTGFYADNFNYAKLFPLQR